MAQRYLGHLITAMTETGHRVDLQAIIENWERPRLEQLARATKSERGLRTQRYLQSLTPHQLNALTGTCDRLAILAESDLGPWLSSPRDQEDRRPRLDLAHVIARGDVAYLCIESDRRPPAAEMLAAAIVQDLIALCSRLQQRPRPTVVVFDEFAALASEQVVRLFGRGRSAGLSIVLGTQELADLTTTATGLQHQVAGNVETIIAHRQNVPDSAEWLAQVAGTQGSWSTTRRSDRWGETPDGTRTRTREFRIHPDDIKRLPTGHAAVINLAQHTADLTAIFSRQHPAQPAETARDPLADRRTPRPARHVSTERRWPT